MSLKQKKMENYKEIGVYNSYEENEFNNRTAKFVGELFKLFVKNKVVIVYKNKKFYITTNNYTKKDKKSIYDTFLSE